MRQLNWKELIGPVSVGALVLGLAACDQDPAIPAEADASSTMASPAPVAIVEEKGAAADAQDEGAAQPREVSTSRVGAAPVRPQPSRPSSAPGASPTPEITRAEPKAETTQAPDPHAGHEMQSMAGHDMEGM